MRSYYPGQRVVLTCRFTDPIAGTPVDVTEPVTFRVKDPDGTVAEHAGAKVSTGIYRASVVVDAPGTWHYRGTSSGDTASVDEGSLRVLETNFP